MSPMALTRISQAKQSASTAMAAVIEAIAAVSQLVHLLADRLLHPRAFHPNSFFRFGEIEAWDRGISQMLDLREEAVSPPPQPPHEPGNLWGRISFTPMPFNAASKARLGNSPERP